MCSQKKKSLKLKGKNYKRLQRRIKEKHSPRIQKKNQSRAQEFKNYLQK